MADASWSGFIGTLGTDITSANAMKWASYSDWDYTHWILIEDTTYPYLGIQENDFSGVSGTDGTDITTSNAKLEASYSGWDFTTVWYIAETYTYPFLINPPALLSDDFIYKKYKNQGVRLTWISDLSKTYEIYKNVSLDLSVYTDGTAANTSNDYIGFAYYLSDSGMFASTPIGTMKFETSTGNYFSYDLNTTPLNGWNTITFLQNSLDETGSPIWSNITNIYLEFNITTGYLDEFLTLGIITLMKQVSSGSSLPQNLDVTDSPTFVGLTLTGITANTALIANASKQITSSPVTSTDLAYITGLDQGVSTINSPSFPTVTISSGTASRVVITDGSKQLTTSTVTSTELGNIAGLDQTLATTDDVDFNSVTLNEGFIGSETITTIGENKSVNKVGLSEHKGKTWIDIGDVAGDETIKDVEYCGNGVCLAGSFNAGNLIRSIDYGQTWTNLGNLGWTGNYINKLCYIGNDIVLLGSYFNNNDLYKSEDKGLTWAITYSFTTNYSIYDIENVGDGIILVGTYRTNNARIYRSSDYGYSFISVVLDTSSSSFNTVLYCGDSVCLGGTNTGRLYKSTNSGSSFSYTLNINGSNSINVLKYCGNNIVLAVVGNQTIYKSLDLGASWTLLHTTTATKIYDLEYLGDGVIVYGATVSSIVSAIYQSVDYGANFAQVFTDSSLYYTQCLKYCGDGIVLAGTGSNTNDSHILRSSIDYNMYQKYLDETDNIQLNSLTLGATPVYDADPSNFPESMLTIQQKEEPSTNPENQISIFATDGADCTIGLMTEAEVVSATPTVAYSIPIKINGTLYNLPLELA